MTDPSEPGLQVRWRTLGAVFLVVATISAVALRWWQSRGEDLPTLSMLLAGLLVLVGAVVLVLGLRVRRWVRGGDPIDGVGATRTLVLGQTAAIAGAVLAGYLSASLVLALLQVSAPEPREVAVRSGLSLLAAAAMAVAGMITQWCCQVPPDDDEQGPLPS